MNRSGARSKRTSVKLVDESLDAKIFATKRTVGRQVVQKYYIVLKREPQFSLESSVRNQCEFIRLTRNNQLVGCIKDGELERSNDLEKIFFLSKLDLKPKSNKSSKADSLHVCTNGSSLDDESESYASNTSNSPSISSAKSCE